MLLHAREVLETCLYVDDLAAARRFYTEVLGLTVFEEQPDRHLFLRCGGGMLLLFLPDASQAAGGMLPAHGAHGPGHVAFAASDEELARWPEHLRAHGVAIEKTVDWPHGARSLYFRDPAGNSLEFAPPRLWGCDE
jgi:catechol 2,3-dioxygenase-like lactoylglutathione lyase family enzyme